MFWNFLALKCFPTLTYFFSTGAVGKAYCLFSWCNFLNLFIPIQPEISSKLRQSFSLFHGVPEINFFICTVNILVCYRSYQWNGVNKTINCLYLVPSNTADIIQEYHHSMMHPSPSFISTVGLQVMFSWISMITEVITIAEHPPVAVCLQAVYNVNLKQENSDEYKCTRNEKIKAQKERISISQQVNTRVV